MEKVTAYHSRKVKLVGADNDRVDTTRFSKDEIDQIKLEHECNHAFDKQIFLYRWLIPRYKLEISITVYVLLQTKLNHFDFFFLIILI